MQFVRITIVAIALGTSCVSAGADRSSPLHGAVEMLHELKDGITKDGEKADAEYIAVTKWCRQSSSEAKYGIKTDKASIEELSAAIIKATSDIASASSKIESQASSQSETERELKAGAAIRGKEHHQFAATEKELLDSMDTLERATNVLQKKMRGAAFVATSINRNDLEKLVATVKGVVNAATLSLHDERKLMSLAQSSEDANADLDEFVAASKAQGGVLDLLEDLKQKAAKQLNELRKEEVDAQRNFEMEKDSLTTQLNLAEKQIAKAKGAKNAAGMVKANAEGEMAEMTKELDVDREDLKTLESTCVDKASDYQEAVRSRTEELQAIESALKALASAGGAAASFLQSSPEKVEVVSLLRKLAQSKHSASLAQLAGRISTVMAQAARHRDFDPFKKAREMIKGMVAKLSAEASKEGDQKKYCDKEKKENQSKKSDLGSSMDQQTAAIDKAKAKHAGLEEEVVALQKRLAEMAKQQADADQIRQEEKETYASLKSDLGRGLSGIRAALDALHQHYGDSLDPNGAHSGGSGPMKAVFALLEVIEEDTSKSLAKAEAEERSAAMGYTKNAKENKKARTVKEESAKYAVKQSKRLAKTLSEHSADLDTLSTELDAVVDYSKRISGMCDVPPESYAERQARREEEMSGLREALAAIEGQASLLQRSAVPKHASLRGVVAH